MTQTLPSVRVGQSIAELRKLRGLTTRQLSARLDELGHRVAPSSISKIEAGNRSVDVDDLVALALALRTTPNRLLFGSRAWTEPVALTPKLAVTGHRAWSWAEGAFPLTSVYPEQMPMAEIQDDFAQHALPVDLRRRRQHPALRASRRLAAMVDALRAVLERPAVDRDEEGRVTVPAEALLQTDPVGSGYALPVHHAADPAAVVAQALTRTQREVGELLEEINGEVPST